MIVVSRIPFLLLFSFASVFAAFTAADAQSDSISIHGVPRIIHYTKKDFQGDPQFWTVCQDTAGILYFGNNDGALIFDGQTWKKVALPNNSSIRSLKLSSDGQIYAGGFNELGVIKKDQFGQYYYESLLHLLRAEDRNIENVWQIHEVQGHILFRSFKMLVAVANGRATTLPTSGRFNLSTVIEDRLIVQDDRTIKILDLQTLAFTDLFDAKDFNDEEVLTLIPGVVNREIIAITKQGSLFKTDFNARKSQFWQRVLPENSNNLLTCALKTKEGDYYVGTLRTKVLSFNASGHQVRSENSFNTLQDNTVHNLFQSNDGNIWAVLNNGVDCIDVKSPMSLVFDDASIYDATIFKRKLVVATNQGVFTSHQINEEAVLSKTHFTNITGLEGQAWSLQQFENKLICSHDKGIFVIDDQGYKKLPGAEGIWKVIPIEGKPHQYLGCSYHGLYLITFSREKGFEIQHKLDGFIESSRDIVQGSESGVFWICHGYKGVFRIKIDDAFKRVVSLEHFRDQNGLPSPFNINVAKWNDEIVFTTNEGIYKYNEASNQFVEHKILTDLFGKELNVRKLLQFKEKTWFAHDNEVGYFFSDSKEPKLEKDLFLQLKGTFNPSMECIVPLSSQNILIGTNTGLYAFNLNYNAGATKAQTIITSVAFDHHDNDGFTFLNVSPTAVEKLPYKSSTVRFSFAAPAFQNKTNVQFSYQLKGVDNGWSPWTEISSKEYSLIRPGSYVFRVRSRSLLGEKGTETSYSFQILPAWYQSTWAVILYFIFGASSIVVFGWLVKRHIDKEQEKTIREEREKRRVLELEIERMKLAGEKAKILKDKEQLEEDVIYKSKELVNYTMLLVKKRELLIEMHDELKALKELVKNDASRQAVRDLLKKINSNLESEEHIRVFEANFERVHHDFFTQLKASFPDLSQKELQLCAFVRMNLTNKEIASILNISVRGIETARYRLRKRLGMSHEEDMAEFLEKLHSAQDGSLGEVEQLSV